jgi:small subunit ribosomal protein S10
MAIISLKKKSIITFKIKSFHNKIFEKSLNKILRKIKFLNISEPKIIPLPIKIQRYTVLKSPHIDKKSREQFEIKSYTKLLILDYEMTSINNIVKMTFLINYIKNSLSGCELKIKYLIK